MKKWIYILSILSVGLLVYTINVSEQNKDLRQTLHAYYTNELAMTSEKMTGIINSY